MLKRILLYGLIFLMLSDLSPLNGQTVRNLRFDQDGKQIHIYYDLLSTESGQTYEVQVYYSTDGGKSLHGPLKKLSGDQGKGIVPGNGKKITWDVLEETENLTGEVLFELVVLSEFSGCKDVDGNTYKTVKLGRQVWMAENLKVTHYPHGAAIPLVTGNKAWANLKDNNSEDAYCYYDNNSISEYGAQYTYAAALNVCPAGWHLPSDAEWTELENYLADNGYNFDGTTRGGRDKIAKAMATDYGWSSSNKTGAIGNSDYPEKRNTTGFSALPGSQRGSFGGMFYHAGGSSYWWSSSERSSSSACFRHLGYSNVNVSRYFGLKSRGHSVRCVRDD